MADDGRIEEQFGILAGKGVEAVPALDPVVALVAGQETASCPAADEVVAFATRDGLALGAAIDEVAAVAAEDQVEAVAGRDDVMTFVAMDDIGCTDIRAAVGEDVVAGSAVQMVDAIAALETVIARPAPERVVTLATNQDVVPGRAAEDDVIDARVAQIIAVGPGCRGVVADDHRTDGLQHQVGMGRVRLAVEAQPRDLLGRVHLEDVSGRLEGCAVDMRRSVVTRVGVAHQELRKGIRLQFVQKVQALGTAEIVEPVAGLQLLHLVFEDIGEA
ncbi:hypothetical protein FG93_03482 [Bosea sp. LC85]|nr:hypothetical protein FG93_03482 [Bosea sp. LC85]